MTDTTIKIPTLNLLNNKPKLNDLLDLHRKNTMLAMNCHAIATIQSFNVDNQTVSATMNYQKTFYRKPAGQQKTQSIKYEPYPVAYPMMVDCPAIILSGGTSYVNTPIQIGDNCIVLFNDKSIDNWFKSGQISQVSNQRLHSFSDGIVLVGLNSLATSIANYDPVRLLLRTRGGTSAGVNPTTEKILLENSLWNFKTIMDTYLIAMKLFIDTNPALGGSAAASAATAAAQAQIDGLFE